MSTEQERAAFEAWWANRGFRVQEYGVCSYWPRSLEQALEAADQIMQRNGCGNIQVRQKDGTWALTHRFEKHAGVVEAIEHARSVEGGKS